MNEKAGCVYIVKNAMKFVLLFICQDGETPLIKATKMRNIEIVELLLDKGAKVAAIDRVCLQTTQFQNFLSF